MLGELYSQTGNPTNATSYILDCITTAKKHYLEYLTALGCLHLAFIQVYSYVMKTRLGLQNLFSYISIRLFCNIINAIYGHKTLLVHTEIAESWFIGFRPIREPYLFENLNFYFIKTAKITAFRNIAMYGNIALSVLK